MVAVPAGKEREHVVCGRVEGQSPAVDFGLEEPRRDVVARTASSVLQDGLHVGPHQCRGGTGALRVVLEVVDPGAERGAGGRPGGSDGYERVAEQRLGPQDTHRLLVGEVPDEVTATLRAVDDVSDQLPRHCADVLVELFDRRRREQVPDHPSVAGVIGRIGLDGDHEAVVAERRHPDHVGTTRIDS